jgi:hypothetical protein
MKMPLVRIELRRGKSPAYKKTIGDAVYPAMTDTFGAPAAIAKSPSPGFAPCGAQPPSPTTGEAKRVHGNA